MRYILSTTSVTFRYHVNVSHLLSIPVLIFHPLLDVSLIQREPIVDTSSTNAHKVSHLLSLLSFSANYFETEWNAAIQKKFRPPFYYFHHKLINIKFKI